jgi:uncharacterized RDD family membrane protein YckC
VNGESGHPPADLTRRLAALGYDVLLVAAVLMLVTLAIVALRGGRPVAPGNLLYQLALVGTTGGFFIAFWVCGGQTLGMRAWRLKVEQGSGEALNWKIGSIRFAAGILSIVTGGLGFVWILADPQKLTWHDRIAGTRVVVLPKEK